jgi:hypothetical protein
MWRVTADAAAPPQTWMPREIPVDTLHFDRIQPVKPGAVYGATVRVESVGHAKAFLWLGATGRFEAFLNGQKVMAEENRTKYRTGQFQQHVELRPGSNELTVRLEALDTRARISAHLVGPRNDGDTVEGIRWKA